MVFARPLGISQGREPRLLHQSRICRLHAAGDSASVESLCVYRILFKSIFRQLKSLSFQILDTLLHFRIKKVFALLIEDADIGIKAGIDRPDAAEYAEHDSEEQVIRD